MSTYFKTNNKKQALYYQELCEEEISKGTHQTKFIGIYYGQSGEVFYLLGEYSKAKEHISSSMSILSEDDCKEKWYNDLLLKCIELKVSSCENTAQDHLHKCGYKSYLVPEGSVSHQLGDAKTEYRSFRDNYIELLVNIIGNFANPLERINALYTALEALIATGHAEGCLELYNKFKPTVESELPEYLKARQVLIESLVKSNPISST